MTETERIRWIWEIEDLGVINTRIHDEHEGIVKIKKKYPVIFAELDGYELKMKQLKARAQELFELEGVNTYPDPHGHGRLTLVSGRRYIKIKKAEETLDPATFAKLVEKGKGYVRWTPPKESTLDD